MEGEKDPRCLLVCLRLACSVLESFGPKIEDLVEVGTAAPPRSCLFVQAVTRIPLPHRTCLM